MDFLHTLNGSAEDIFIDGGEVGFVIAHSIGGAPDECARFAEQLGARGHAVSCPLLLGHGGSQILLGATGATHWLATLAQAHDTLASKCRHVVLAGYLTGALLALRLAQTGRCKPLATLLAAPAVWPPGWEAGAVTRALLRLPVRSAAAMFRIAERAPFGIGDAALRAEALSVADQDSAWHNGEFRRSAAAAYEARRITGDVLADLGSIAAPTLVVMPRAGGQGDIMLVERLQRGLGGRVEVVLLDDSLYRVLEDRQRDLVADHAGQFVEAAVQDEEARLAGLTPEQLDFPERS